MASVNDLITDTRNAARPVSTTVSAPRAAGGTTLACGSLNWPIASKIHGVTYQIDSNSNPVAGTQLDFYGIVSGSSITQFTVVDGTDIGNSIGDVVEMLPTAAWGQDLADWGIAQHSRTGAHVGVTNTGGMTTDTLTVTSGTTLPAGDIATADIADSAVTTAKVNSAAITAPKIGTDSSFAWQSWTPSWVNLTIGNATVEAKYSQIGKTITCRVYVSLGTTSSVGSNPTFSLPVTSVTYPSTLHVIGSAYLQAKNGLITWSSTTAAIPRVWDANNDLGSVTNSNPVAWGAGSIMTFTFTYEAA